MVKFFENKKNQLIVGIVVGIILVGAIVLILTGKIDLKSIMGNTAQGKYTCPEGQGYTLNEKTKKCERTIESAATYQCPNGYVENDNTPDTNDCKKEVSVVCPKDSTWNGETCVKKKLKNKYECKNGGNLSGTTCIMDLSKSTKYTCPTNWHPYGSSASQCAQSGIISYGTCPGNNWIKDTTKGQCKISRVYYTCDGVNTSSSSCKTYVDWGKLCPSGYVKQSDGRTCIKSAKKNYYSCTLFGGVQDGDYCVKSLVTNVSCPQGGDPNKYGDCIKNATKICPDGWSNYGSSQCAQPATLTYGSCQTGWTPYKTGNECAQAKSCPSGSIPIGQKCYITTKKSYFCLNGGDPSGSKCVKTEIINATYVEPEKKPELICKVGYKLKDGNCVKIEETKTCPEGQELKDGKCVDKVTDTQETINITSARNDWATNTDFLNNKNGIVVMATPGKNEVTINCTTSNSKVVKLNKTTYSFKESIQLNVTGVGAGKATITCKTTNNQVSTYELELCNPEEFNIEKYSGCKKQETITCPEGQELKNGKCVEKQTVTPVTCPEGQELINGKCVIKKPLKPIDPICPEGQELKDGKCVDKQSTTDDKKEDISSPIVKKCPEGYTQTGEICTKTETINATVKYSCANGYTLKGSKCEKMDTKEPTSTFTCPTGYAKSGNGCYRIDTKAANVSYSCETGYILNKSTRKCEKTSTIEVKVGSYTCPEGYDLVEGTKKCVKATQISNLPSCPYTYLGGVCIKFDYQNASTMNSCPSGYSLNGEYCQGKTTVDAISKYSCSAGYTLNGKTCTKKITKTVNTKKYCPTGYTLSNNKCTKTIVVAAKPTYTCASGYTLNGTTCTRTITTELKVTY